MTFLAADNLYHLTEHNSWNQGANSHIVFVSEGSPIIIGLSVCLSALSMTCFLFVRCWSNFNGSKSIIPPILWRHLLKRSMSHFLKPQWQIFIKVCVHVIMYSTHIVCLQSRSINSRLCNVYSHRINLPVHCCSKTEQIKCQINWLIWLVCYI